MGLQLATKKKEVRIEYREDNNKESSPVLAVFICEALTPSEIDKLIDKHTSEKWSKPPGKNQVKQRFPDFDTIGFKHDKVHKIIKNWEGVQDEKGKDIPCNRDNKIDIFEHNPSVINYVLEQMDEITEIQEAEEEAETKN